MANREENKPPWGEVSASAFLLKIGWLAIPHLQPHPALPICYSSLSADLASLCDFQCSSNYSIFEIEIISSFLFPDYSHPLHNPEAAVSLSSSGTNHPIESSLSASKKPEVFKWNRICAFILALIKI